MDKTTYENITRNAKLIAGFAAAPQRLRSIAKVLSFGKKEVLEVASLLESVPSALFSPAVFRAYQIYLILLKNSNQPLETIADKLDAAPSTVQQTIIALKSGGALVPERATKTTTTKTTKATPVARSKARKGQGAEFANQNLSNEQRIEEVIAAVKAAVEKLEKLHDWDSLSTREKIRLLQQETREARGVGVSSQTLYREWLRDLW